MKNKWNETCESCDRIKECPSATHCDNCSGRIDAWVVHFQEQEVTYSFTIYLDNGDKYHTQGEGLEDAQFTFNNLKADNACFSIFKFVGNEGDEISDNFFSCEVA